MTYRKVGGLHHVKLGRFGCAFYRSRRRYNQRTHALCNRPEKSVDAPKRERVQWFDRWDAAALVALCVAWGVFLTY